MAYDLRAVLGQLARDKGIDQDALVEVIETAMLSAAKKHYGHNKNLETQYDQEQGTIEVLEFKTVVEEVEDPDTQITVSEARKFFDPEAMVGDELGRKLDTEMLGRIAAQTAKQVIIQKVRDAERGVIFEEYKNSKGDLINGIVQRYDRGNLIVNLGRTEAILPRREQIARERYRQGDRLRGMILDIDPSARGPQIILTRSHPDFLKELFKLEVPEISDGVIELKAVAREPGERAKIAVHSNDASIDPVGACVGIKGSRVQSVVQELRGERIDIITWTPDEPSFVARALAPAEVSRVVVDEDDQSMEVIVADDQLSLAIGRRGQNVKLASKLTGWRIDVRSISVAEEEAKRARTALENIPGMDFTQVERLFQEGYRSVREVANASLSELADIDGFDEEVAKKILDSAIAVSEQVGEELVEGENEELEEQLSDLDRLMLSPEVREKLIKGGYPTIQSLVSADSESLSEIEGLEEQELEEIKEATNSFFRSSIPARAF
jgi:N utilization substance protein A